jgi:uncharacterized protein
MVTIQEIETRTLEYGENWALAHVRRLFRLIDIIGRELEYDQQALQWAVYLHDWGSFPKYAAPGVDHALRSRQVAESEILPDTGLTAETKAEILEAIELHDYRDMRPVHTNEALLLREADYLDFLGAIGIARGFCRGQKDLKASCKLILARKEAVQGRFTLPIAKNMAEERLARMESFFQALADESFGEL